MYSAAPGRVAEDGVPGRGSPFARAFQKRFAETDVELRVAVGKISDAVAAETGNRQLPFSTLSLSGVPIVMLRNEDRPAPPMPIVPGTEFRDCDVCPLMVVVPAGSFMMGSPPDEALRSDNEGPQRGVTITEVFAVGKFELAFAEWDTCAAAGGCAPEGEEPYRPRDGNWGRSDRPAINVSWLDAKRYVRWLNRRVGGSTYRLLTEPEWEYAARGGTTTAYPWGAAVSRENANYLGVGGRDTWETTAPRGSFPPNALGLHDMHGNVWEWVEDCYAPSPGASYLNGYCPDRVIRGGGWQAEAKHLRSATREGAQPSQQHDGIGFRVARGALTARFE
jgi:formylglycine-generating enzyme required for sulfatase activity